MAESDEKNTPIQYEDISSSRVILHAFNGFLGGTVAILFYFGAFWSLGMRIPPVFLLAYFILGAIFGMFFGDLGARNLKSRFLIHLIAAFAGIVAPFCLIQLLFLWSW